jgi:hypothetical protein
MDPKAIDTLLELAEYEGPVEAFLKESVARIQATLNCTREESERTLQNLRDRGAIDFRITPGGLLPMGDIPIARWYWYVP